MLNSIGVLQTSDNATDHRGNVNFTVIQRYIVDT